MLSIFNKVNNLDINVEYEKIRDELRADRFRYNGYFYSFFRFLDTSNQFKRWRYRDTILTTTEYLEHIDIIKDGKYKSKLTEIEFLYFTEFILNMAPLTRICLMSDRDTEDFRFLINNIKLVLEKMGYETKREDDKVVLVRKDADVDSIIELADEKLQALIIKYKDFRVENDFFEKSSILKKIDLYIEKDQKLYKEKDNATYSLIGKITNNFEVNHPAKETLNSDDAKKFIETCDDCFLLMIHLIRSVEYSTLKKKYTEILGK